MSEKLESFLIQKKLAEILKNTIPEKIQTYKHRFDGFSLEIENGQDCIHIKFITPKIKPKEDARFIITSPYQDDNGGKQLEIIHFNHVISYNSSGIFYIDDSLILSSDFSYYLLTVDKLEIIPENFYYYDKQVFKRKHVLEALQACDFTLLNQE